MDKKREILNNQQLTDTVDDHEIRITKLETKKKKTIKKCGKGPKVTIADVMQTLMEFQISVAKFQDSVKKDISNLSDRVYKIENEVFKN